MTAGRRLALASVTAGVVAVLWWSYGVGASKRVYVLTPLDEPVSLPVVYDTHIGRATRVGADRVKVVWGPVDAVRGEADTVATCIGTIPAGGERSYVLEIGGALYVERAEFIDPLIAVVDYARRHGGLPPWLARVLNDPELDRNALVEVLAEISRRP